MTSSSHYLINGESDIGLSPMDRGLAYGDGVFRTLRVSHGSPDAWGMHYHKLKSDCALLGIACPDADLLLGDIDQLFTPEEEAVAKIIITRGTGPRGYAMPSLENPARIVIRESFPHYPPTNFTEGVSLHLCQLRLSHQPRLAGIKHLNRLENVLARAEWADTAIADGLLLDEAGWMIECTMSNLFARFGDKLATPALDQCGVAGITRQRILDLAPNLGLVPEITRFGLDELYRADEVLICNSLYGAWQVRLIDGHRLPVGELAGRIRLLLQE